MSKPQVPFFDLERLHHRSLSYQFVLHAVVVAIAVRNEDGRHGIPRLQRDAANYELQRGKNLGVQELRASEIQITGGRGFSRSFSSAVAAKVFAGFRCQESIMIGQNQIDNSLASLKKSDTVIDLLKYIPYVAQDSEFDEVEIAKDCICVDYRGEQCQRIIVEGEGPEYFADPGEMLLENDDLFWLRSPHMAALGRSQAVDNGFWMYCDTQSGAIYFIDLLVSLMNIADSPSKSFTDRNAEFTSFLLLPCAVRGLLRA